MKDAICICLYLYENIKVICLFAICFFCYEMLIMSCLFFMGCFSFCFNEILFMCILHTHHQSVVCVTNIFSKLVSCLFTFVMVSFDVRQF